MVRKVESLAKQRKKKGESMGAAAKRAVRQLRQYQDVEELEGFASGDESKMHDHDDEIEEAKNGKTTDNND